MKAARAPAQPPRVRATIWLTLGEAPGTVQLWLAKPARVGGRWELPEGQPKLVQAGSGPVSTKFAAWSREATVREFRVAPDTDRELICCGGGQLLAAPVQPPRN